MDNKAEWIVTTKNNYWFNKETPVYKFFEKHNKTAVSSLYTFILSFGWK